MNNIVSIIIVEKTARVYPSHQLSKHSSFYS